MESCSSQGAIEATPNISISSLFVNLQASMGIFRTGCAHQMRKTRLQSWQGIIAASVETLQEDPGTQAARSSSGRVHRDSWQGAI